VFTYSFPLLLPYVVFHHLAPAAPPQDVVGESYSHDTLLIQWLPPPSEQQHGPIVGYKVLYVENIKDKTSADADSMVVRDTTQARLSNLQIYTEYKIWVLAFTSAGDSPMSSPVIVRTLESGGYSIAQIIMQKSHNPLNLFCEYVEKLTNERTLL